MADQGQMFENNEQPPKQEGMFSVGDRQYTAEDAKKKIENADNFIETLKTEKSEIENKYSQMEQQIAELRSRLDTSLKLEDALKAQANPPKEDEPAQQPQQTAPVVDEASIIAKLREELSKDSEQNQQAVNLKDSIEKATQKYGKDWQDALVQKGKEYEMDQGAIEQMAKTNPVLFSKLFELNSKAQVTPAPSGGSSFNGSQDQQEKPKSVMFGSSTKDLVDQWRYSGKKIAEQNSFEYDPSLHQIAKQKR